MNNIQEIMAGIDLSPMESRTYLALLELEEAQTGILCKQAKVASSNIYKVLQSLIEKGLASYRLQNNIKVFMPSPPEALQELFKQKEQSLKKEEQELMGLIQNLKKRVIQKEPYSRYKYFEGISGLKSLWTEMLEESTEKDLARTFLRRDPEHNPMLGYFHEWHLQRVKKKINTRMIFPTGSKIGILRSKMPHTLVRYIPYKDAEAVWGTMGKYLYLEYSIGKQPRGFLIEDDIFVKAFNVVFDNLWNNSKKNP